jgi:nucleoside-diphosphate-sugar epimerase
MLLAESNNAVGEVINIGSNNEISIGEVASIIKSQMESDIDIVLDPQRIRPKKSEVVRLWCDNKKIKEIVNFEPKFDIYSGLQETIAWFQDQENLAKYKSDIYNI